MPPTSAPAVGAEAAAACPVPAILASAGTGASCSWQHRRLGRRPSFHGSELPLRGSSVAGRDGCSLETVSLRFAGSSWGVVCRAPLCTACRSTFSWPQIQRQEAEQRSLRAGGRGWRVQEGPEVGTGTTRGEVVWGKSVTGQTLAVAAPEGTPGWSLSHVCKSKPG